MGYLFPEYGADGDFGNERGDAVAKFQKARGIGIDRVVGKNTWSELMKD